MTDFKTALALLKNGKFKDACEILEDLITRDPRNSDMLYNLGMCYTEIGKPEAAIRTLTQCIQHAPGFANAYVAMGFAYAELNDFAKAKEFLFKALEIEPNNPYAFRNLGGVFGKEENFANALYYLKKAHEIIPDDPQTLYGLAFTYFNLNDFTNAHAYFSHLLEINAPAFLKDMAKDRLREIAVTNAKSHGFRPDAMYYCLNALKLFSTKEFDEVRKISYEIAMKGRDGLDINNPNKKYTLNSLPGYFSGIQLLCYMYVGFKRIASKEDVGIDFSAEYRMASELFDSEDIL